MNGVRVLAPAKLNLGLAVLGKRPDGYHEIDTIMTMIDLCDEIIIHQNTKPGIALIGMDDVPAENNLIHRATNLWCAEVGREPGYEIQVRKRIPSPGGLGGGSSDAAATLRALNALHNHPLTNDQLHDLAAQIGADCPFFLGTSTARATGIGTEISPIQSPRGAVVAIVPSVKVEAKTAKLYGSLRPSDFGHREEIDEIERSLEHDQTLGESELRNSFTRAVEDMMPSIRDLRTSLRSHGIEASLTGAGPGLYVLTSALDVANEIHTVVRDHLDAATFSCTTSFLGSVPLPEILQ